jgi:hypothetical protein
VQFAALAPMRRRAAYLSRTQKALTDKMNVGIQNAIVRVHMTAVYSHRPFQSFAWVPAARWFVVASAL